MPRFEITDPDDPRLDVYRRLNQSNLTRWSGRFIAEGARVVQRLVESPFAVESVLVSDQREPPVDAWLPRQLTRYVLSRDLARKLVGYNFHTGVLACGLRQPGPALDELLRRADAPALLIVCPDVQDPENVGHLIRLGAAFGVTALMLGSACADPFSRRVLRVSMGNAFQLPIVQSDDVERDLRRLRDEFGVTLTATVLNQHAQPLDTAARPQRLALLFGNEAHGLDEGWTTLCDQQVTIPMSGGTDSLNVAMAASIFLYHFTQGELCRLLAPQ